MYVKNIDRDKITEFESKITTKIIQVRIEIKNKIFFPLPSIAQRNF